MKKAFAIALAVGAGVVTIVYVASYIKDVVTVLGNYNILYNSSKHQFSEI